MPAPGAKKIGNLPQSTAAGVSFASHLSPEEAQAFADKAGALLQAEGADFSTVKLPQGFYIGPGPHQDELTRQFFVAALNQIHRMADEQAHAGGRKAAAEIKTPVINSRLALAMKKYSLETGATMSQAYVKLAPSMSDEVLPEADPYAGRWRQIHTVADRLSKTGAMSYSAGLEVAKKQALAA